MAATPVSTDRQTMEYYSLLERKENLTPAITGMDLGSITLSAISQLQKD